MAARYLCLFTVVLTLLAACSTPRHTIKHDVQVQKSVTEVVEDQGPEYQRLVERFVSGLPALASRFEEVLGSRQWEELRVLAHQLKGMGGGFGFPGLTDQAAALESTLLAGDYLESAEQAVEVVEAMRSIHGSGGQVAASGRE